MKRKEKKKKSTEKGRNGKGKRLEMEEHVQEAGIRKGITETKEKKKEGNRQEKEK